MGKLGGKAAWVRTHLTLPWPPSVNVLWRHVGPKVLVSKRGREYREEVMMSVLAQSLGHTKQGPLSFIAVFHQPDHRRRDLDNLLKSMLDCLKHAGVYEDDSQIHHIDIRFAPYVVEGGSVDVTLMPYKG